MIAETILAERKRRNWTQQDLSKNCGIAQPLIANYENGKIPSSKNLKKLCDALGLSVESLLAGKPVKKAEDLSGFDEFGFEKKLKEVRKFSVSEKRIIEGVIDLAIANQKFKKGAKTFQELTQFDT